MKPLGEVIQLFRTKGFNMLVTLCYMSSSLAKREMLQKMQVDVCKFKNLNWEINAQIILKWNYKASKNVRWSKSFWGGYTRIKGTGLCLKDHFGLTILAQTACRNEARGHLLNPVGKIKYNGVREWPWFRRQEGKPQTRQRSDKRQLSHLLLCCCGLIKILSQLLYWLYPNLYKQTIILKTGDLYIYLLWCCNNTAARYLVDSGDHS